MKAAVVRAFGTPLAIETRAVPEPGRGEVLVRLAATGVCHSDLHSVDGELVTRAKLPFVPGHEGAGVVAACGPEVEGPVPGDRVGVTWLYDACGTCDYCVSGWESLCPRQRNTGFAVDGCYADYVVAPAAFVVKLPDELSFGAAAPILCAGVTTYKGLKQTGAGAGEWVVISGIGGLGHVAVQYARAMGLRVAAVDVSDDKLALARRLGAEVTVNAATDNAPRAIRSATGGGAHGALVTASSARAFGAAVSMLRRRGTCVLIGLPPGDVALPIADVVLKALTVRGSIVGTRKDLREALALAARHHVVAEIEYQPLDAVNAVLDRMRAGSIEGRVVLDLNGAGASE